MSSDRASCGSCGAPMRWVTPLAGKPMPLDAEPNPEGNVEMVTTPAGPRAKVHAKGQGGLLGERWMPHHASCPQGREWRRPR